MPQDTQELFAEVVKKFSSNSSRIEKEKQKEQERKRSYCEKYARSLKNYINATMKNIANCNQFELGKKIILSQHTGLVKNEYFNPYFVCVLVTENDIQALLEFRLLDSRVISYLPDMFDENIINEYLKDDKMCIFYDKSQATILIHYQPYKEKYYADPKLLRLRRC